MIKQQETMILSPYMGIYDLVIPKDNFLRKINELIDFSFIYNQLLNRYCLDNARNAISPIRMLINKTVGIAIDKGIIKSKSIIVDATHTKARYNEKIPKQILMDRSKKLRKSVYDIDENMKEKFPRKTTTDVLEDEIEYCKKLINVIEREDTISKYPKVKEKLNLLRETLEDHIKHLQISEVEDTKIGHKTADPSFLVLKHIFP